MKKFWLLLILFSVGTAHASQFFRVTKNDSVVGYKEPTTQSKMLNVFKENDVIEVVAEKDAWYKIKIPFNQGYFLYGWVMKSSPNMAIMGPPPPPPAGSARKNAEETPKAKSTKSTGMQRNAVVDDDDEKGNHHVRLFGGPVFSLYKYGAFQYRFGLSYEIPVADAFKLGVPLSYLTGDGFNSVMAGIEAMYSFYFGSLAFTPHIGAGFEYFYGAGKSFQSITTEVGPSVEMSISNHFGIGIEPFTVQAMVWNNTDKINKVPFNLRGQSFILLRGRW